MSEQPIRVGVVGVGRGQSFMGGGASVAGLELVAICDTWEARLHEVGAQYGVATYTDFDAMLEHDLDAVVLANYFHEHAPLAIRALRAGKHVMSECASNNTLAEGVALCRAVEETGRVYMLAENYPFTKFNQEMARLYRVGEIGRVLYAEGEYNHPMAYDDILRISPGLAHWRSRLPATYYCTHALAPLMWITGDWPVAVNALALSAPELEDPTVRLGDTGAVILCRMASGAVFRLFGVGVPGHSNWYRVHGTRGAMESVRGPGYFGPEQVRVWHDPWTLQPGEVSERVYVPEWPEHGDLAAQAGHGGGDFWTNFHFARAIRTGEPNLLDVYHGVAMSSVGILAWKSALADGQPIPMPDFRDEAARAPFADDTWSPFNDAPGNPPPSLRGDRTPVPEAIAHARAVWAEIGYKEE